MIKGNAQCQVCKIVTRCIERQPKLMRFTVKSYENGGSIQSYPAIDTTTDDYKRIFAVADFFAQQGKTVILTPKFDGGKACPDYDKIYGSLKGTKYYGKCPDMSIDGVWYEHEGYAGNNPKSSFRNMLNHGLKQSDRIIVEDCGLTDRYMERVVFNRNNCSEKIEEVWIHKSGTIILLNKTKG